MASAGNPSANNLTMSGLMVPVPPRAPRVIRKVATALGWNAARCSSRCQPRMLLQMTIRMPASPVDPPTTPLQKPAPAPASAAALDLRQSGPHEIVEAEENEQDADRNAKMRWRYPSQHQYADGNADRAAGDQGDEPAGIDRVTQ